MGMLETRLAGPLTENIVRIYTKEVLLGLRHLHKMGIMHRDIKGQNVLVDQQGHTKLADFGASTQIHNVMDSVSGDGVILGHHDCQVEHLQVIEQASGM